MDQREQYVLAAHIHHLVSDQVNREIEDLSRVADDIISGIMDAVDEEGNPVDVFEWWTVSRDFAVVARRMGEIIIETLYGFVWARQTTGISLSYDPVVIDILDNIPRQ
jgi:hypothetical protein